LLVRQKLTKPVIFSWFKRMTSHTGTEIRPRLLVSSEEFWTMSESLI
jgi:hypothetical protein